MKHPGSKSDRNRPEGTTIKTAAALTAIIMSHGLAGSAAAAEQPAQAAGTPATTNSVTQLPEVIVQGQQETYNPEVISSPKYTVPLRDVPQTVTIIPKAVIQDQNATTLRDVLRNVSGISMQAGEGGVPAGDNLSIRGFNARTDIFIDGVRDFGGYSRDPFNLEQVEVAKGPASTYVGRGSTGGSSNLVTKKPFLNPLYSGSLGFGTDEYKRVTLDVNQPLGEIGLSTGAFRLNGMWTDADTPGRNTVENERWAVAPSFAIGLGTPTRLTLSYLHLDQDNVPDYGIPWVPVGNVPLAAYVDQAPPVSFDNFYGILARDYEKTVTDIVTAQVEHEFSESIRLSNITRYGNNDRDSVITAPRFASTNSVAINRQFQSRDMVDTIFANQTDLRFDFSTGPVEHTLVPGIDFAHETSENFLRTAPAAPQADLYNPNPHDPYTGTVVRTGAVNKSTSDSVGIYAFDTIRFTDQWQLNGGLRWDYFDTEYRSTATNGVSSTLERTDRMLSWRVGPVFKPLPNGSIYAAYGTSFNPSAEGLTLSTATTLLEPEESRTYEIGTKWDFFRGRLSLSSAIFRTDKTNARTPGVLPTDPPTVLDGEQRVQGIEFGVAGQITPDWQIFAGYTYLDSEVRTSNNPVEVGREFSNAPQHSFNLWTTYQLPFNIEIGGGAQYVGDRLNSTTATRIAPDYWLFDAMVAYEINQHVTLRLNIYNIADKEYIDRIGGGHFVPGAGRSAMLTASFRY